MAEWVAHAGTALRLSFVASAPIVGGNLVKVTGNMTIGPCTAATDIAIGVVVRDAAVNQSVAVACRGYLLVDLVAVTNVAAGDTVGPTTTSGQIGTVVATASPIVVGIALEAILAGAKGRVLMGIG